MPFQPGQQASPQTQFKPGQSGNPKGRPKGNSVRALFSRIIKADRGIADKLARTAVDKAIDGDYRYFKAVIGKVDRPTEDIISEAIKQAIIRMIERDEQTLTMKD